ncbi:hypothetical protein ACNOYE_08995 [Nannocystaceae bacterium ST9]
MSRLGLLATWIACWTSACVARTSTNEVTEVPPVFTERDAAELESECPSVVTDPQSLFAGRLELRLPIGVALIEQDSSELVARDATAGCVGARTIRALIVLERPDDDPSLPIGFVRDQLLDHLALPDGLKITTREEDDGARRMTSIIAVPADPALGRDRPTRILLALRGGSGRIYALIFEASAEQFQALLPSFEASLESLRIPE